MVRLTDKDLAISDTEIDIISNGAIVQYHEVERPIKARHYQLSNCDLTFPTSFVSEGMNFEIHVSNKLTNVWVTCSVDRQASFIPRWARRPDGTKVAHIAAKIGRPCWKGKTVVIPGMEDCVERCPEGFHFSGKDFALERKQTFFELTESEFPDLNEAQKKEKIDQAVEEKLAEVGGPERDGEMVGGFMTIRIYDIESFQVKNRSQQGGYFKEERQLKTADVSVGGAATAPGGDFQQISRVTGRSSDWKQRPGRLLFCKVIRYGLEHNKGKKRMGFDEIADAVHEEITKEKKILKGRGKWGKGKKGKGKGKGNSGGGGSKISNDQAEKAMVGGKGNGKSRNARRRANRGNREGAEQ